MRWIACPTSLLVAALFAAPAFGQVEAARDTSPVVLKGTELGDWSAPSNQTVQPPLMDFLDCPYTVNPDGFGDPTQDGADGVTGGFEQNCPAGYDSHNHYADPAIDTKDTLGTGAPVDHLLGFR